MLKPIAQFIATKAGFTVGSTLQFGFWGPNAPERAVLVAFNAGGRVYFYQPGRADLQVQVLCRAPKDNYLDAYADAKKIYDVLHGTISAAAALPIIVSGEAFIAETIEALAPPQYIGPDDQGRHLWSTNYTFRIKKAGT